MTAFDPDIAALIDGELRRQIKRGDRFGELCTAGRDAGPRFGLDQ